MSRAPRRPGETRHRDEPRREVAIGRIARQALDRAADIVARWLPDGRRQGAEWVARNPTRSDAKPGSFKVNTATGCWADFSTGDRGGDLVSLAAYLFKTNQVEAARGVADMLSVSAYDEPVRPAQR